MIKPVTRSSNRDRSGDFKRLDQPPPAAPSPPQTESVIALCFDADGCAA
jgi:hypothetical protein